jgi:WD40 repeat protein
LWDVSRGSAEVGGALFELAGYSATLSGTIAAESISSDGALVANRTKETVQIWDVKARRQARPPLKHGGYVRSASFVDGGRLLVVGGDDKAAAVWDMRVVGDAPKFALSHTANVDGVEVSPDGRTVLTRSDDGFARLWDATTGRALFPPLEHSCALRFGMFIAGGRAVMTRSRDDVNCPRVAILWNVATGQRYSTMDMTGASAVGFSPSGTLMFSDHRPGGSEFQDDGTVSIMRVWNANSGELRFIEPFTSKDNVIAAAFTPDGTHLMIASGRQVSLWAVSATRLQSTLGASTRLCLKPEFRRQNLGETAPEASERYIACERRRGRK